MEYKHFGIYLRELRESRQWTQEQLAQGICSSKQIYRIEKGTYEPSLYLLNQLSIKFNLDLNTYYKIHFSNSSTSSFYVYNQIQDAIKANNLKLLKDLVHQYNLHPDFTTGSNLQLMCYAKALILSLDNQEYLSSIDICYKGIYIEAPSFDLKNIRNSFLSNTGMALINTLRLNYYRLGEYEKSKEILIDLIYSIEYFSINATNSFNEVSEFVKKFYQLLLFNLCILLFDQNNFKDAIIYAEKGISYSNKINSIRYLPELLFIKFQVLYSQDNMIAAKEIYTQCTTLLQITQQHTKLDDVHDVVQKKYPELLDN